MKFSFKYPSKSIYKRINVKQNIIIFFSTDYLYFELMVLKFIKKMRNFDFCFSIIK